MAAVLPLNPAYGWIANFRAAALGTPFDGYSLLVSGAVTLVLLLAACMYFRRVESRLRRHHLILDLSLGEDRPTL